MSLETKWQTAKAAVKTRITRRDTDLVQSQIAAVDGGAQDTSRGPLITRRSIFGAVGVSLAVAVAGCDGPSRPRGTGTTGTYAPTEAPTAPTGIGGSSSAPGNPEGTPTSAKPTPTEPTQAGTPDGHPTPTERPTPPDHFPLEGAVRNISPVTSEDARKIRNASHIGGPADQMGDTTVPAGGAIYKIDVPVVKGYPECAVLIGDFNQGPTPRLEFVPDGQSEWQRFTQPTGGGSVAFIAVLPRQTAIRTTHSDGAWVRVNEPDAHAVQAEVTSRLQDVGKQRPDRIVVLDSMTSSGYRARVFSQRDGYINPVQTHTYKFNA